MFENLHFSISASTLDITHQLFLKIYISWIHLEMSDSCRCLRKTNKKHWNTDNNFINKYLSTAGKKKMPSNVVLLSDFETINTSESLRPSTDIFVYGM